MHLFGWCCCCSFSSSSSSVWLRSRNTGALNCSTHNKRKNVLYFLLFVCWIETKWTNERITLKALKNIFWWWCVICIWPFACENHQTCPNAPCKLINKLIASNRISDTFVPSFSSRRLDCHLVLCSLCFSSLFILYYHEQCIHTHILNVCMCKCVTLQRLISWQRLYYLFFFAFVFVFIYSFVVVVAIL